MRRAGALALLLALAAAPAARAQVRLRPGVTLRALEAAAARDSNDPAALYDLALGYWSERRWDDADRALRTALAIEPRNASALLALAHLPFARRPRLWDEVDARRVPPAWRPAVDEWDRLTRLAFLVDPLVDLAIVGAVAPPDDPRPRDASAATPFRTAMVALANFRNGQYDQAYGWLDRLARLLGEDEDSTSVPGLVLWYRGISAAHLNDLPGAIRDLSRLEARPEREEGFWNGPDRAQVTYVLAWLEERAGRPAEARAHYQAALASDLGLWMAHVQLARLHEQAAEWPEAIRERQLALEAGPDDPTLLLDLGTTLTLAGRAAEALAPLARAAAGMPRNFRVPYYQGRAAQQLGRAAEAREAYRRFLALVPSRYAEQIAEVRRQLEQLP